MQIQLFKLPAYEKLDKKFLICMILYKINKIRKKKHYKKQKLENFPPLIFFRVGQIASCKAAPDPQHWASTGTSQELSRKQCYRSY
jgi:hypothetical protein